MICLSMQERAPGGTLSVYLSMQERVSVARFLYTSVCIKSCRRQVFYIAGHMNMIQRIIFE